MRKIINSKTKQYETVSTDEWTLDDEPTAGSFNGITSDGVANAIGNLGQPLQWKGPATVAQLNAHGAAWLDRNKPYLPRDSYQVSFVPPGSRGLHTLEQLNLFDEVTVSRSAEQGIRLHCSDAALCCDQSNTALRAARVFEQRFGPLGGIDIYSEKYKKLLRHIRENFENLDKENIQFEDLQVKAICCKNWDTNNDGELSYAEAAAVTDIGDVFSNNKNIITNFCSSFCVFRFYW